MPDSRDISKQRVSDDGVNLIKRFEGYREYAVETPQGGWVVGFGHTKLATPNKSIAADDADKLLRYYDLPVIENALLDNVLTPMDQNEFDALVAFVFNIGLDQFLNSAVLVFLNQGDKISACEAMGRWYMAEIGGRQMRVDALVRRRAEERALFLRTSSQHAALAPSAIISPLELPREADLALPDPDLPKVSQLLRDDPFKTPIIDLDPSALQDGADEDNTNTVQSEPHGTEEDDTPDIDVPTLSEDDKLALELENGITDPDETESIADSVEIGTAQDEATDTIVSDAEPSWLDDASATDDSEAAEFGTPPIHEPVNPFDSLDRNAKLSDAADGRVVLVDAMVDEENSETHFENQDSDDEGFVFSYTDEPDDDATWPETAQALNDDVFDNEAIEPMAKQKSQKKNSGLVSMSILASLYALAGVVLAGAGLSRVGSADNFSKSFEIFGLEIKPEHILATGTILLLIGGFILWRNFFSKD